jgi:hypothetical protein
MDLVVVVVLPPSTAIRTLQWSVSATPVSAPAPIPVPSSLFVVGSPEKRFTSPKKSPPTNRRGWATAGRAMAAANHKESNIKRERRLLRALTIDISIPPPAS